METLLFFLLILVAGSFIGSIYLLRKRKIHLKDEASEPRPIIEPASQSPVIGKDRYNEYQPKEDNYVPPVEGDPDNSLINTIIAAEVASELFSDNSPSIDDMPDTAPEDYSSDNSMDSPSTDFGGGDFGGGGAGGDW
jgi:uncharacterized membrane protein YgcG